MRFLLNKWEHPLAPIEIKLDDILTINDDDNDVICKLSLSKDINDSADTMYNFGDININIWHYKKCYSVKYEHSSFTSLFYVRISHCVDSGESQTIQICLVDSDT